MKDALTGGRAWGAKWNGCAGSTATFLVDDRVHLVSEPGRTACTWAETRLAVSGSPRRLLPAGTIIGATANTFEDIARAAAAGADYIGLGPFRFTETKPTEPDPRAGGLPDDFEVAARRGITLSRWRPSEDYYG